MRVSQDAVSRCSPDRLYAISERGDVWRWRDAKIDEVRSPVSGSRDTLTRRPVRSWEAVAIIKFLSSEIEVGPTDNEVTGAS